MLDRRFLALLGGRMAVVAALGSGCSSDPAPSGPPSSKDGGGAETNGPLDEAAVDAPPSPACSPGTRLDPYDKSIECSGGLCICRTYAPDGGLLMPVPEVGVARTDVISFQLPEPMKAGQAYAFSVTLA